MTNGVIVQNESLLMDGSRLIQLGNASIIEDYKSNEGPVIDEDKKKIKILQ